KKIYLPKLIFPLSKVSARMIDFVLSMVALLLIGLFCGFQYTPALIAVPVAMGILFFFTLGVSILVSVATVYFRDVQYFLNVFLQLLYFATPIMYPEDMLPGQYRQIMGLNPLLSQIHLFQAILYDGRLPTAFEWTQGLLIAFLTWALGLTV